MSTLLFPGRHLVNTRFQVEYLLAALGQAPRQIVGLEHGRALPETPVTRVVFAITSSNQDNSRYNPIPFHIRAIGVDRFARELLATRSFTYRIVGIPHYGHTENFAAFTLKEIAAETENAEPLTPENTVVLCSTREVIKLYAALGFSIATAELSAGSKVPEPIELVRAVADAEPGALPELSAATRSLFADFPEVPQRIRRIYRDPLTNQEGSLTETRNYNTYARGMNEILRLKYLDIREAIRPGRLVDEGCADGGLLAEIAQDFRDSDLFGIDLSAEFAARFQERKRAGDFGNVYTCFHLRNLLDPIFEPGSVDTTICNSTLHELWSYAEQAKTVRAYLAMKFVQLRPGGRLIIRDVVGPEEGERLVVLELLTPAARAGFARFATDFLRELRERGRRDPNTTVRAEPVAGGVRVTLRIAAEFLSKKDYVDNWASEMNEEFCFWSYPQWRAVLGEIGFRVLDAGPNWRAGSRVYTNPWIVEHRYQGQARLLSSEAPHTELAFPPTNMVLVAEKPV